MSALQDIIFRLLTDKGPLTGKEILEELQNKNISTDREEINKILYGPLHSLVIRDVNEKKIPVWRIRTARFEAATGLENLLYQTLIKEKIITRDNSKQDFGVKNRRNNKRYHLDIAVFKDNNKYNIEVDGFDHIRADALASLERQIIEKNEKIEIDWMDNTKSFVAYNEINTSLVYKWCGEHIDWCVRYHEELLWPKDITRNLYLIESGWKVIRFWNAQLSKDLEGCINEISEWLHSEVK